MINDITEYESVKEYLNKNSHFINFEGLERFYDELLQYRREHNIYEVGDIIVHPSMSYGYLYKIYEIKDILINVQCLGVGGRKSTSFKRDIRHATDEEIKAGCRL